MLVYQPGKRPQGKKWERILKEAGLYDEAVRRLDAAWDALLAPHRKTPAASSGAAK